MQIVPQGAYVRVFGVERFGFGHRKFEKAEASQADDAGCVPLPASGTYWLYVLYEFHSDIPCTGICTCTSATAVRSLRVEVPCGL